MARTSNEHQGTSSQIRGLFDLLGPHDEAAFKEVLRAARQPSGDAKKAFFGHAYFVSEFELEHGQTLRLKETPNAEIAQALAMLGDPDTFCTHGAMTENHLIICFGLADWVGRLLVIGKAAFDSFLDSEWPDSGLPQAERRMLRQLLIGQSPAQAASADGVAYETKRTYVKLTCRRFNVSGQVELVSAVLGRLLIAINVLATDHASNQQPDPLNTYKQEFLPPSARVLQLLDCNGDKIKILDIGPQKGRPVLLVHPTIPPFFSDAVGARLSDLNLRVLVPLRPGIFDPGAQVMASKDYVDRTLEGLALCKSLLAGQDAPVLGLSTGGNWAVRFAQRYPSLAPKLFLASMTFQTPKDGSLLGRFLDSFSRMVVERPAFVDLYVDFLLIRHKDTARFRKMNDKVFSPETPDGKAMEWEFSQPSALEAYMHFYQASPAFLKSDGHASYYVEAQDISELSCNVHMLHGVENQRDGIETIRDLVAGSPNAQLTELPGAGHVLRGAHLDAVWDFIADSN